MTAVGFEAPLFLTSLEPLAVHGFGGGNICVPTPQGKTALCMLLRPSTAAIACGLAQLVGCYW